MIVAIITDVSRKTAGYNESKRTVGITVQAEYYENVDVEVDPIEVKLDVPTTQAHLFIVGETLTIEYSTPQGKVDMKEANLSMA